jgi:biopolymer transport protein ExbB
MHLLVAIAGTLLLLSGSAAGAGEAVESETTSPNPDPTSLEELLDLVTAGFEVERDENRQREQEFLRAREGQEELLAEALAVLAGEQAQSEALERTYNDNEPAIGENEERLTERLGELGELFGVVRQVSADLGAQIWESLTSSQLGSRGELLDRLGRGKEIPSTTDLEELWVELQREITAQGQIVPYRVEVLTTAGSKEEMNVIRAGPFTAIAEGRYLLWEPRDQRLRQLSRQPPSKYLSTVTPFERAHSGFVDLAVDPSRGALLSALIDIPDPMERVQQGGYVGYVIIVLGVLAFGLGVVRWATIGVVARRVAAQQKSDRISTGNPLGRILSVYENSRRADPETLELRLDEAVVRESAKLERFLWIVKAVSVVAPLLGLLGTVTGMIQTFQAITLYGAGDPKMMAGGISEALVTTMLGLTTAIPLVLLSSTLANSARRINYVLDEKSAGLIALRAEEANVEH